MTEGRETTEATDIEDPEDVTDIEDMEEASDVEVALIAAVAENRVIGADGEMPWHYPADLDHFKRTTTGHPVIVGRRTYERIVDRLGGPLPDRTTVVLTTRELDLPDGAVAVDGADRAMTRARQAAAALGVDTVYVVGGATVYDAYLDRANRLVLTEIHDSFEGDTYFPEWRDERWREVDRDDRGEFSFVTYERQ